MIQYRFHFFNALASNFGFGQKARKRLQFFFITPLKGQYRLQLFNGGSRQTSFAEFQIDFLRPDFIQLIYGYSNIHQTITSPNVFGNTSQYFPVVQFHNNPNVELLVNLINNLNQLYLVELTEAPYDIHITLNKLAITAPLGTIGPPYRMNLITFKGEIQFALMLHHKAGKGHDQVVAQTLLTNLPGQFG